MRVRDYMSASPITIGVDDVYGNAFEIMARKDLHQLPVVNSKGEITGILTRRDLRDTSARCLPRCPK